MRIKNDQAGLTLVELLVTIVVASIVTLSACTMLLFGLRINNQSTKNSMGQNTVQVLMEALEDVAAEAKNLGIEANLNSWMLYDTNGTDDNLYDDTVFFTYLSEEQTIYSGRTFLEETTQTIVGTPFLKGIHSSEVEYDAETQLLSIAVQTMQDSYSTSIYCRMGTQSVKKGDPLADLLIEYLINGGEVPGVDLPLDDSGRFSFLKTLASQIDSKGKIAGTRDEGKYYATWYQENKPGTTGDWGKDTAWCACYLSWAMNQEEVASKIVGVEVPLEATVDNKQARSSMLYYFYSSQNGSKYNEKTEHGVPVSFDSGDLIFFNFDEDKEADHVGVVLATEGNYIYTIEGNTAGKVAVRKYDKNDKRIMGYGVLNWIQSN